jgi:hypothetical protein
MTHAIYVNGEPVAEELIGQESARIARDPRWGAVADESERARRLQAAAGAGQAEGAPASTVMYRDSFGNVAPASPAALAAGTMPIPYLAGREAIHDFIFSTAPQQRRLSTIPLQSPVNGQQYQPYVLHTCDEDLSASTPGTGAPAPSHAVAFRTVDISVNSGMQPPYGGGKLGIYSYWPSPCPEGESPESSQTKPVTSDPPTNEQQFEFYFYSPYDGNLSPNPAEIGNQAFSDGAPTWESDAQNYYNCFIGTSVQNELNQVPSQTYITSAYNQAGVWSGTALGNYLTYAKSVLGGCTE